MKAKKLVFNALLLGLGLVLHQLTPAIFGVKPDMSLIMLFVIVMMNHKDYKTCLACGVLAGIFSALTTTFPGGQIPNLIDKCITVNVVYLLLILIKPLKSAYKTNIVLIVGTAVSGLIFLYSAQIIVGLPGNMNLYALYASAVFPAIVINTIVGNIVYKACKLIIK